MKQHMIYALGLVFLLVCQSSYAQLSSMNNNGLHLESIDKVQAKKYLIEVNYNSIEGNINNEESPLFVYKPSTNDYMIFARKYFNYFMEVKRKGELSLQIKLVQRIHRDGNTDFVYIMINPNTHQMVQIPSAHKGDLITHRAEELASGKFNDKGSLADDKKNLNYNEKDYDIIAFDDIKSELQAFIDHFKLYDPESDLFDVEPDQVVLK